MKWPKMLKIFRKGCFVRLFVFFIAVFLSFGAHAQELEVFCNSLPEYQKGADVEFVPGRDDVVPADIKPLNAAVPEVIDIPINVQLLERFPDLDIPTDLELEPTVSVISVHQNGRVSYNGQDVSKQIYTACGENAEIPEVADDGVNRGQDGDDTLNSDTVMVKEGIEAEILGPKAVDTASDILEGQHPE